MKLAKFAFVCAAAVSLTAVADGEYTSSTLAILPVTKTLNAMPLTVNFTDANGNSLSAENVVKTANLPEKSYLYVYNNGVYIKYTLNADKSGWALVQNKTYTIGANGALTEGEGTTSENLPVARGAAVFLETPSTFSGNFYVAGTPGSGTTTVSPGANLIGAPTAAAFDLNSNTATWGTGTEGNGIAASTFTGAEATAKITEFGDMIEVPTADGGSSDSYYYRAGEGWNCWGKFTRSGRTSTFVKTDCVVPAGRGFWYVRKAGSSNMTITW